MKKTSIFIRGICMFVALCFFTTDALALPATLSRGNSVETYASRAFKNFQVPEQLGRIEESYEGTLPKTVLFIQDAHDSLEAQENIAKIIENTVENYGVRTVYEEGYEGRVPTDDFFLKIKNPEVREKAAYFLMDKLRIGGAEYAHINRKRDFRLIGADDIHLHLKNILAYKKSARSRKLVSRDLLAIKQELQILIHLHFPKELKDWLKLKERYHQNKLPLLEYLKRTFSHHEKKEDYPTLQNLLVAYESKTEESLGILNTLDSQAFFREMEKLEEAVSKSYLKTRRDRTIFRYYHDALLLEKLNQIRLTQPEFEVLRKKLKTLKTRDVVSFIAKEKGKPVVLSQSWESLIHVAFEFYELAQKRDGAILKQFEAFVRNPAEHTVVLVFGGFHKNKIKELLQKRGFSYHIISPAITQISERHQEYYKHLMQGRHHAFEIPFYVTQATRALHRFIQALVRGNSFDRELAAISGIIESRPELRGELLSRKIMTALSEQGSFVRNEARESPKKLLVDKEALSHEMMIPVSRRSLLKFVGLFSIAGWFTGCAHFLPDPRTAPRRLTESEIGYSDKIHSFPKFHFPKNPSEIPEDRDIAKSLLRMLDFEMKMFLKTRVKIKEGELRWESSFDTAKEARKDALEFIAELGLKLLNNPVKLRDGKAANYGILWDMYKKGWVDREELEALKNRINKKEPLMQKMRFLYGKLFPEYFSHYNLFFEASTVRVMHEKEPVSVTIVEVRPVKGPPKEREVQLIDGRKSSVTLRYLAPSTTFGYLKFDPQAGAMPGHMASTVRGSRIIFIHEDHALTTLTRFAKDMDHLANQEENKTPLPDGGEAKDLEEAMAALRWNLLNAALQDFKPIKEKRRDIVKKMVHFFHQTVLHHEATHIEDHFDPNIKFKILGNAAYTEARGIINELRASSSPKLALYFRWFMAKHATRHGGHEKVNQYIRNRMAHLIYQAKHEGPKEKPYFQIEVSNLNQKTTQFSELDEKTQMEVISQLWKLTDNEILKLLEKISERIDQDFERKEEAEEEKTEGARLFETPQLLNFIESTTLIAQLNLADGRAESRRPEAPETNLLERPQYRKDDIGERILQGFLFVMVTGAIWIPVLLNFVLLKPRPATYEEPAVPAKEEVVVDPAASEESVEDVSPELLEAVAETPKYIKALDKIVLRYQKMFKTKSFGYLAQAQEIIETRPTFMGKLLLKFGVAEEDVPEEVIEEYRQKFVSLIVEEVSNRPAGDDMDATTNQAPSQARNENREQKTLAHLLGYMMDRGLYGAKEAQNSKMIAKGTGLHASVAAKRLNELFRAGLVKKGKNATYYLDEDLRILTLEDITQEIGSLAAFHTLQGSQAKNAKKKIPGVIADKRKEVERQLAIEAAEKRVGKGRAETRETKPKTNLSPQRKHISPILAEIFSLPPHMERDLRALLEFGSTALGILIASYFIFPSEVEDEDVVRSEEIQQIFNQPIRADRSAARNEARSKNSKLVKMTSKTELSEGGYLIKEKKNFYIRKIDKTPKGDFIHVSFRGRGAVSRASEIAYARGWFKGAEYVAPEYVMGNREIMPEVFGEYPTKPSAKRELKRREVQYGEDVNMRSRLLAGEHSDRALLRAADEFHIRLPRVEDADSRSEARANIEMPQTNIVPVVTSLNADGTIDEESIQLLLDSLEGQGTEAILVMGQSGEFDKLDNRTRMEVIKIFTERAPPEMEIYANVSGDDEAQTLVNIETVKSLPLRGIVLAPLYYLNTDQEMVAHIKSIETSFPIILYNNPHLTGGRNIAPSVVLELLNFIVAIKDSSGDLELLERYIELGLPVYQGDETKIFEAMQLGAAGAVSILGNVNALSDDLTQAALEEREAKEEPDEMGSLIDLELEDDDDADESGEFEEEISLVSEELQREINGIVPILTINRQNIIAGTKYALYILGRIRVPVVAHGTPELTNTERSKIKEHLLRDRMDDGHFRASLEKTLRQYTRQFQDGLVSWDNEQLKNALQWAIEAEYRDLAAQFRDLIKMREEAFKFGDVYRESLFNIEKRLDLAFLLPRVELDLLDRELEGLGEIVKEQRGAQSEGADVIAYLGH